MGYIPTEHWYIRNAVSDQRYLRICTVIFAIFAAILAASLIMQDILLILISFPSLWTSAYPVAQGTNFFRDWWFLRRGVFIKLDLYLDSNRSVLQWIEETFPKSHYHLCGYEVIKVKAEIAVIIKLMT